MAQDDDQYKMAQQALQAANTDSSERILAAGHIQATLSVSNQIYWLREEVSRLADILESLGRTANASERVAEAAESLRDHVEGIKFDLQNRR